MEMILGNTVLSRAPQSMSLTESAAYLVTNGKCHHALGSPRSILWRHFLHVANRINHSPVESTNERLEDCDARYNCGFTPLSKRAMADFSDSSTKRRRVHEAAHGNVENECS